MNEEDRAFGQPHRGHDERIDSGEPLLQFFAYQHLPGHLQAISMLFCDLAEHLVQRLPRNPERTVALRKLLESKDCAVRAALWKP